MMVTEPGLKMKLDPNDPKEFPNQVSCGYFPSKVCGRILVGMNLLIHSANVYGIYQPEPNEEIEPLQLLKQRETLV